jgi:hypothetical protein
MDAARLGIEDELGERSDMIGKTPLAVMAVCVSGALSMAFAQGAGEKIVEYS